MRAAAINGFGGPEVLKLQTLPVPQIEAHEILIAIDTAGVGSWDAAMRGSWWPSGKPTFPLVLGTDGSGIVAAVGSRVRRFMAGDRVYAYSFLNPKGGFYAEYVAVDSDKVGHVPEALDLVEAGAIGTTGLTALQGIDDALRLKSGETLVVHGGSGGVGTLAVQFAKLRGARVFATASGKDGVALAHRLDVDTAVDGKHGDVHATLQRFAPDGVDALLALAGGAALDVCVKAVRPGGRIAYPNGVEPEPTGVAGVKVSAYDAIPGVSQFEQLNKAIEASHLKIVIADSYPLEQASKAHERLEKGHVPGKIVARAM
jgi:NADPH:quinone reductase-like Zn-dependent oxidoreductase